MKGRIVEGGKHILPPSEDPGSIQSRIPAASTMRWGDIFTDPSYINEQGAPPYVVQGKDHQSDYEACDIFKMGVWVRNDA